MAGNSRKCKSQKMSHVVEEVDTLNNFPDEILNHILSFLDTKSAVRTSLLSRRWRCLWKNVQVLNFLPESFCKVTSFRKHVYKLLSLRSHHTPVRDVTFDVSGYTAEETRGHVVKAIEQVMNYAAFHGGGGLECLSITGEDENMNFGNFDKYTFAGNRVASLKTMKLEECAFERNQFDDGRAKERALGYKPCKPSFKSLTTLELRECSLSPRRPVSPFDLIGDLPCLKYLKLLNCYVATPNIPLLISGPQLLELEIEFTNHYRFYKLIAPKLKSLRLWGEYIDKHLPKLDLPSLDHANIRLKWKPLHWADDAALEELSSAFVNYLCGLHNVESLKLCFDKEGNKAWEEHHFPLNKIEALIEQAWEEHHFPLNRIEALIEHEAPPFTRLKTLRIQCAHQQRQPIVSDEVLRYFLECSPNTEEEKFVEVEMLVD